MTKHHPVVKAFLEGAKDLLRVLRALPEPRSPVITAMLALREAANGHRSYASAIRAAHAVPVAMKAVRPDLFILFLCDWTHCCIQAGIHEEIPALIHLIRAFVTDTLPPGLKAHIALLESAWQITGHDSAKREEKIKEALSHIGEDNPRYPHVLLEYLRYLARWGRLAEGDRHVACLQRRQPDPDMKAGLDFILLTNAVQTGNLEDARQHLLDLETSSAWTAKLQFRIGAGRLEKLKIQLALLEERWQPPAHDVPQPERIRIDDLTPAVIRNHLQYTWAMVAHALLHRQVQAALDWARLDTRLRNKLMPDTPNITTDLIRAELAAGNHEAARRLLEQGTVIGATKGLLDFYHARMELLAGKQQKAADFFHAVLNNIRKYRALGRLDFELKMACEMSPGALVDLTCRAVNTHKPRSSPPSDTKSFRAIRIGVHRLRGRSPAMETIRNIVLQFAPLDVAVLITGETGTGKELVARSLHETGPRSKHPFLAINCGAISEHLLESELFGHEKGAFTGAMQTHEGLFKEAGRGTLLLDEIGDISSRLQVALLRVLESGEYRPVGSSRIQKISCRIIAATNEDLERQIEEKKFRKDLYYRLSRLHIDLPPLRKRPQDIIPLTMHFLNVGRDKDAQTAVSEALMERMRAYPWPGNIRELKNEVERMRLMNSDKLFYDLPDLNKKIAGIIQDRSIRQCAPHTAAVPPASARTAQVHAAASTQSVNGFLLHGKSRFRRLQRIREYFQVHRTLTRKEIAELAGVSLHTATQDLKFLCQEDFIRKVMPTASTRTHYFVLKERQSP